MLSQMAEINSVHLTSNVIGWTDVNSILFIKQKQRLVLCEWEFLFCYYLNNVEFDFKLSLKLFPAGLFSV